MTLTGQFAHKNVCVIVQRLRLTDRALENLDGNDCGESENVEHDVVRCFRQKFQVFLGT
jgi:hypothetical protein